MLQKAIVILAACPGLLRWPGAAQTKPATPRRKRRPPSRRPGIPVRPRIGLPRIPGAPDKWRPLADRYKEIQDALAKKRLPAQRSHRHLGSGIRRCPAPLPAGSESGAKRQAEFAFHHRAGPRTQARNTRGKAPRYATLNRGGLPTSPATVHTTDAAARFRLISNLLALPVHRINDTLAVRAERGMQPGVQRRIRAQPFKIAQLLFASPAISILTSSGGYIRTWYTLFPSGDQADGPSTDGSVRVSLPSGLISDSFPIPADRDPFSGWRPDRYRVCAQ